MQLYWIWLSHKSGINDREKLLLAERFPNPEDIYHASEKELAQLEGISANAVAALAQKDLSDARRIVRQCMDRSIRILTWSDESYPVCLRNIADPPLVLYYRGQLPDFDAMPVIGIVGTRKASPYGLQIAQKFGREIVNSGGIVVSGMAEGIDAMATKGALHRKNCTVGVLGCGVDRIYPACNRDLFRQMAQEGCLLSEFPPGAKPDKWNFPRRNRIISGLSNGIIVVEAPKKSGALITARQALEQGRDVFAVPGNVGVSACEGSNALLKDGAGLATSGYDVLSEYAVIYPGKIHQVAEEKEVAVVCDDKKAVDNPALPLYSDVDDSISDLTDTERTVLALLKPQEQSIDLLIAQSQMPTAQFLASLTMLEVKGYAHTLPGRRVIRNV